MPTILTIIAHPDDETMLSGGALALLARAGAEVHYLCATRGEGGEVGEPPRCTREELGTVREGEMRCAVQTLGGMRVEFLEYVDPLVGENDVLYPYTNDFEGLVAKISEHLKRLQPEVVISHGSSGEYGHPAHILTHLAVRKAIEKLGDQAPMLYTFEGEVYQITTDAGGLISAAGLVEGSSVTYSVIINLDVDGYVISNSIGKSDRIDNADHDYFYWVMHPGFWTERVVQSGYHRSSSCKPTRISD